MSYAVKTKAARTNSPGRRFFWTDRSASIRGRAGGAVRPVASWARINVAYGVDARCQSPSSRGALKLMNIARPSIDRHDTFNAPELAAGIPTWRVSET